MSIKPASLPVPAPIPSTFSADDIASLAVFAEFRGVSKELKKRIAHIEKSVVQRDRDRAFALAEELGATRQLLEGARLAKKFAAQVDVVLHTAGILQALPHILVEGEIVESVSLGAGNTKRDYDLETTLQIAEFKFINWQGGSESVRQNGIVIDIFKLAKSDTVKDRKLYLTGIGTPTHWLETSERPTRDCLESKKGLIEEFNNRYGSSEYTFVREYWEAVRGRVQIVDLNPLVPGLSGLDEVATEESEIL